MVQKKNAEPLDGTSLVKSGRFTVTSAKMKSRIFLIIASMGIASCSNVKMISSGIYRASAVTDASLVGLYRYPDVYWSTMIELRGDHTFLYEQLTDTFQHTSFDGTWAQEGQHVALRSKALSGELEFYIPVRKGSDIGLLREKSLEELRAQNDLRFVFEQTCWRSWGEKKPNRSTEQPSPNPADSP